MNSNTPKGNTMETDKLKKAIYEAAQIMVKVESLDIYVRVGKAKVVASIDAGTFKAGKLAINDFGTLFIG
jgi:hypothetical protein